MRDPLTVGVLYRFRNSESKLDDIKNFLLSRETGCIYCDVDLDRLCPVLLAPPGFLIAPASPDSLLVVLALRLSASTFVKCSRSSARGMWFVAAIERSEVENEPHPIEVVFGESPVEAVVVRSAVSGITNYDANGRSTNYRPHTAR